MDPGEEDVREDCVPRRGAATIEAPPVAANGEEVDVVVAAAVDSAVSVGCLGELLVLSSKDCTALS